MKTCLKLLCLVLLLASITSLVSCGDGTPEYNVNIKTDSEKKQITFECTYSDKYASCGINTAGTRNTEIVSDTTQKLEDGSNRRTVVYALKNSNLTVFLVNFKGKNEKDNTAATAYRAETVGEYIVVKNLQNMTA